MGIHVIINEVFSEIEFIWKSCPFAKMTSAPENELANFFFRDNCVCVGKGEGGGGPRRIFGLLSETNTCNIKLSRGGVGQDPFFPFTLYCVN